MKFLSPEDVRVLLYDVRCERSILRLRIGFFLACILALNIKVHQKSYFTTQYFTKKSHFYYTFMVYVLPYM